LTAYLLFGLFAATLLGIATLHRFALPIAVTGMLLITTTRLALTDLSLVAHFHHEWQTLLNLAGLLLGFALLASHFERSHLPDRLTKVLPGGRLGAFLLLVLVCVLSTVLDNIAAALIGGSAALVLFRRNVHIGYLAAIVAASNAGGAGSVLGDTTTTMIWLEGVSPLSVAEAGIGAIVAVLFFGWFASIQQHRLQPLQASEGPGEHVDGVRLGIVGLILVGAIIANFAIGFPAAGVWAAILVGMLLRPTDWKVLPGAAKGTVFLLSLVFAASMMPVEELPAASLQTAFGLGVVSAFFDNIPLTKLAIQQDGYDWGFLAYCVGYGGSMVWFGSSAGVAIASVFPQAKNAVAWVKASWHVSIGYVLGFTAMVVLLGWHPHPIRPAGAPHTPAEAHTGR
jgi:Na+/H+ antiporter NhaD/arsenite permease-like protein